MTAEALTYSLPDAAAALGVSRRHLGDLIARGEFPALRLGRRVVVPKVAIERAIERSLAAWAPVEVEAVS